MKNTKTKTTASTYDIENIYAGIVAAENQRSTANKGDKDYLKPKAGSTYLVKLLPYKEDFAKTFVQYDFHGWQSIEPGRQYVTTGACPRTWGNKCIVCDAGYAAYNRKEQYLGDLKSKLLLKRTTFMINVLVIEDPVNPENIGTIKVLRYGQVLNQKFHDALYGDDKEELGSRVFNFTPEGVHLKIQVERKGGNANAPLTYEKSKFLSSAKLDFSSLPEFGEALDQAKDLTTFIPKTKSDSEIVALLDKHFHGGSPTMSPAHDTDDGNDDDALAPKSNLRFPAQDTSAMNDIDQEVASLLEGLNG